MRRLRDRLSGTREALSQGIERILVGKSTIDEDVLEELEEFLITSDIGVQTSMDLVQSLAKGSSGASDPGDLKELLRQEIVSMLTLEPPAHERPAPDTGPHVVLVVGVNGVGKTTTIGKMAARAAADGKQVVIAAADTFRAAAIEQLTVWADRAGAQIVKRKERADPAAVAYDSMEAAVARNADLVLVDTAGRLHTKTNLMEELKKVKRTISKVIPDAPHEVLLVLDATTGQNAVSQTELFHNALGITGIALAKLDGTAKGGILVSICRSFNIPLRYIGIGEKLEDLQDFDPLAYTEALFGT